VLKVLTDPAFLAAALTLAATGLAGALILLIRISMHVGEIHFQVRTMWSWWIEHVGKLEVRRPEDERRELAEKTVRGSG